VRTFESSIEKLVNSGMVKKSDKPDTKKLGDVMEDEIRYEMTEVSRSSLSKRRKERIETIESALEELGFNIEVGVGHSRHADVWVNDEGKLFVDKNYLLQKKDNFCTEVIINVVRHASADSDTRAGIEDNISMRKTFYQACFGDQFRSESTLAEVMQKLRKGKL